MEKKKLDHLICFLTSLVFIFVGYSLFFNDTANYDHMDMYDNISSYPFLDFTRAMSYGRVGLYFFNKIYKLFALVGVTKLHNEWVIQLLFMLVLAYAVTVLYRTYEGYFVLKHKHVVIPLIISFGFVNPFFVDNLVYVALEYGFAMLLIAWAVEACDKDKWWLAGVLTFLSISIYQSYYILLFIWGTMLIFLKFDGEFYIRNLNEAKSCEMSDRNDRSNRSPFVNYIYLALTGLIPAVLNIVSVKVFLQFVDAEDMKAVSMFDSKGQSFVIYIFSAIYHCFDTMLSLAPKFYLGIILVVISGIIFAYMIATKQKISRIIYVIVVCIAMVMFTFTIFATGYKDIVPRVLFTVFAGVSMIALIGVYLMSDKWLQAMLVVLAVVGLSDITITQTCCTDYYIAIQHDAQMAGVIQDYIEDYEEQTGNTITTIATSQFKYLERQNKHQIMGGQFPNYIQKSAHAHWCRADMINFFCGTSYVDDFIEDDKYVNLFAEKESSWTEFNPDEQLVFDGNTVYWAVY